MRHERDVRIAVSTELAAIELVDVGAGAPAKCGVPFRRTEYAA